MGILDRFRRSTVIVSTIQKPGLTARPSAYARILEIVESEAAVRLNRWWKERKLSMDVIGEVAAPPDDTLIQHLLDVLTTTEVGFSTVDKTEYPRIFSRLQNLADNPTWSAACKERIEFLHQEVYRIASQRKE